MKESTKKKEEKEAESGGRILAAGETEAEGESVKGAGGRRRIDDEGEGKKRAGTVH